jgi:hypothetical protein
VVVQGDTLPGVAYQEYGDAALWRAVADVNGIDDPARLRPGRRLLLPTADELLRQAPPTAPRTPVTTPRAGSPAVTPAPRREVAGAVR